MMSTEKSPSPFPPHSTNTTTMAKTLLRPKPSFLSDGVLFVGGAMVAMLLVWVFWSFSNPSPNSNPNPDFSSTVMDGLKSTVPNMGSTEKLDCGRTGDGDQGTVNPRYDPPASTFYDDPNLSYSIEKPMKNWDEKRRTWLNHHPSFAAGVQDRILMVTGSQYKPCKNPIGDHLLLRFFKNKVDYCRIHGYEIFYNNALFHPKMTTFWAKLPLVKAAMLAHPESEWIWWVDSDAAFTDMDFKLPLEKYRDHNLIVHGWPHLVYEEKSWVSLNAGIFLIRNCQWAMDFMEVWAGMGPQTPNYDTWSKTLKSTFKDKLFPESDDQSALVYLLLKEKEKWAARIYLESDYYFEGYWVEIVGKFSNTTERYVEMERRVRGLRRRHAERVSEFYGEVREKYLKEAGYGHGYGYGSWRRPFITHFTGCQPCSGDHNEIYSGENCLNEMQRALNFADNQVLRNYGLVRRDLLDPAVSSVPFDYPAA